LTQRKSLGWILKKA